MVQKTKFKQLCSFVVLVSMLFACNPARRMNKDYNYFQKGLDSTLSSIKYNEPTILAGDIITIQVIAGSLSQQDASLFNLSSSSLAAASSGSISSANSSSGATYVVDKEGFILMPKIGKIKSIGFTKEELGKQITHKLVNEELVKDPLVIVKLAQFRVNVLGEVKKPGTIIFKSEKSNILEVLAEAGDLTENGKREDIIVMRQENEKWVTYKLNLLNTSFFKSEAFYLKNNDVIYVGTNDTKLKALSFSPNMQKDLALASTALQTLFFLLQAALIIRSFK